MSHTCFRITVIIVKLPGQIRKYIEQQGELGWRVIAVGPSLLFMEKTSDDPYDCRMESITLKRPSGILKQIEEECAAGWELGAMGSNFLFLNRPRGSAVRAQREFRLETIAGRTTSQILRQTLDLGESGWEARGMGSALLLLQRSPVDTRPRGSLLENIFFKTPDGLKELLHLRATERWKLGGASRTYMIFSQLAMVAPAPAAAAPAADRARPDSGDHAD